ncbi:hypothetical protein LEP1GSC017_0017 [Leptospira meyeri serovar Hardjo str. Went 5]|nr:hypothetical protein LEP1GSC017_0017 [Leptospira meyeri serovar Hardjo str. Went 5]
MNSFTSPSYYYTLYFFKFLKFQKENQKEQSFQLALSTSF